MPTYGNKNFRNIGTGGTNIYQRIQSASGGGSGNSRFLIQEHNRPNVTTGSGYKGSTSYTYQSPYITFNDTVTGAKFIFNPGTFNYNSYNLNFLSSVPTSQFELVRSSGSQSGYQYQNSMIPIINAAYGYTTSNTTNPAVYFLHVYFNNTTPFFTNAGIPNTTPVETIPGDTNTYTLQNNGYGYKSLEGKLYWLPAEPSPASQGVSANLASYWEFLWAQVLKDFTTAINVFGL